MPCRQLGRELDGRTAVWQHSQAGGRGVRWELNAALGVIGSNSSSTCTSSIPTVMSSAHVLYCLPHTTVLPLQLPQRRPSELKRLSKKNKTINRVYGGALSHAVVKER